jgi:ATP-dependent protease ClpP protease subunit
MELINPKIFITEFSVESALKSVEQLNTLSHMFGPEQPIVVQIESYGGSVDGLSIIYDALKASDNPIITYTTGMAMSAGAFLFSAGAEPGNRIIGENATIMIHEVQAGAVGDIKHLREELKLTERINDNWMGILAHSMGLDNIDALKQIMRRKSESNEMYLTAQEAIELKIADKIGTIKLQPSVGFSILVVPPMEKKDCNCDECSCDNEEMAERVEKAKKNKKLPKVPTTKSGGVLKKKYNKKGK